MPSFEELLNDKTTYPDDRKVQLAEGIEVTVGDLRGGHLRRDDYSRKTATLARERQELETAKGQLQADREEAERALAEMAKDVVAKTRAAGQEPGKADIEEELERSPIARKLMETVQTLTKRLDENDQRAKKQEEALVAHETTWYADKHRQVLGFLKSRDKDLNEEELIEYAKQHRIPFLDVAYKAYRSEHLVEEARKTGREEGDKAGYERGKKEAVSPSLPIRRTPTPLPADAPKTFEEAADAALKDPEIQESLRELGTL